MYSDLLLERILTFLSYGHAHHRDLRVLTHSFPPRGSSDLSEIQSAEARRSSVLANTPAEIANARAALAAAEARVTALEGSGIGQSREALRLAQLSYRAGKSSLIELLDAQQAYASTQAELIAARRARAEAQATLARQAAAASEVDLEQ